MGLHQNTCDSDNGGEFSNENFTEMCEAFNITIKKTAAEAPFSNGLVERHNAVLEEMLSKTCEERYANIDIILQWAINAKNSLSNVHGFSPYQLVFGLNPRLPSTLVNKPPALEEFSVSKMVAANLKAMQEARKAFMSSESSEKIARALRHNVSSYKDAIFVSGDNVYYKRRDSKKWKGPAKVIGVDGQQILVKHGSFYYRCHPSHVILSEYTREQKGNIKQSKAIERNEHTIEKEDNEDTIEKEDNVDQVIKAVVERNNVEWSDDSEDDYQYERSEGATSEEVNSDSEDIEDTVKSSSSDDVAESFKENEDNGDDITEKSSDVAAESSQENNPTIMSGTVPKKGTKIAYQLPESDEFLEATVLGRAGRANGKHKYWINVQKEDESLGSLNLEELIEWKELQHSEDILLTNVEDQIDVKVAKARELENWCSHGVYIEVPNQGQRCISTRWVVTEKLRDGRKVIKARLVARGFEEENLHKLRKDSPTCGKESIRILFAVIVSKGWLMNSLDIKSAFLQGKEISRDLFIKPPFEAATPMIWKLKKTVYGLSDASRTWYLRVKEEFISCGATVSRYDEAIFFWRYQGNLHGIMCCHVDDFCWGGSELFKTKVIGEIHKKFQISQEESAKFKYIGLEICQLSNEIRVQQSSYIKSIDKINIVKSRIKTDDLTDEESHQLRAAAGQLNWVSNQTRPDVAFDAGQASISVSKGTVSDLYVANKSINKLKSEEVVLKFKDIGDVTKARITAYSDASHANLKNGSSQGGYIIFLHGENDCVTPLSWRSRKVKRVVRSTLAAETLALNEAADQSFFVRAILCEVFGLEINRRVLPIKIFTDNHSLVQSVYSTKTVDDKRLLIDISCLREKLSNQEIDQIVWIEKKYQLADCLTKNGASAANLLQVLQNCFIKAY